MGSIVAAEIIVPGPPGTGGITVGTADARYGAIADVATNSAATLGMPTVVTSNYTRHLSRYASLAAAVADLPDAGATGGEIAVDGEVTWTGTASLPANVHLLGRGKGTTALLMPASPTVPMLKLDSASGAVVADLAIMLPEGTSGGSGVYGLHITGTTDDVLIERVFIDRAYRGLNVEGWAGTTPGTVTNLTLRDVTANRSTGTFGINLDDVDGVTLDNCVAESNTLDGVKLRKKARNVTFLGGRYNNNGTGVAGDGVDCYSGGDTVTIVGTEFAGNNGQGLTIKGNGGGLDPAEYGYVKNAQFANIRCLNNASSGLYLEGGLVSGVSITGGLFEGNGTSGTGDGLLLDGRNVTVTGAVARNNQQYGFSVPATATNTTLTGCIAIANGRASAGTYTGYNIAGNGGSMRDCRATGVDVRDSVDLAGIAALTKYHLYGFRIGSDLAGPWTMDGCVSTYHSGSGETGIRIYATSGNVVIRHVLTTNPGTTTHGSIGSEAVNTAAASAADVAWVKTSGAINSGATGWVRIPSGQTSAYTTTNVTTDRTYDADTVAVAELADIVGTLIADLKAAKVIT